MAVPGGGQGPGRRDRLLSVVAPALLVAVALWQLVQVSRHDLSRWKGGGFGMFSTVDSPGARVLRLHLETDLGTVPVPVAPELAELAVVARTLPTRERLEALARRMTEIAWVPQRLEAPSRRYRRALERLRDQLPASRPERREVIAALAEIEAVQSSADFASGTPDEVDLGAYRFYRPARGAEARGGGALKVRAVRITVLRPSFSARPARLELRPMASVEVPRAVAPGPR